ncbi:hypothetical protein [Kocuria palustris]|jgi:hypothetical protein|uniref:hypothetical protein n=1 Tax=Kocuria palustris TaxID=71999 RepID=UPI002043F8F3|nr:hypothetical protein [Kocuria palustris]MCM3332693.1 hypothetical protein [Kocuria palustris]
MTYRTPKLVGQKIPMNMSQPPHIHRAATLEAQRLGVSRAVYIEHLVARDLGLPSPLENREDSEELPTDTTT